MTEIQSKKIILFDDDEDILLICSYILNKDGWDVHAFTDCTQVIERVSSIMPAVILMDNWIPDVGGIETTQQLKSHPKLKDIPVIYFSANWDIHQLAEIAGAESYLAKPFNLDDLLKKVNDFCVLPT